MVVTIDGPAGAGKSTAARALASRLKFSYLDTGAMYRALTLKAVRNSLDLTDEKGLVELAKKTTIDLKGEDSGVRVLLDGEDVSREIRTPEITNQTHHIARAPGVRAVMVEWQREFGRRHDIVAEGRDLGTVVFPDALVKFYLDADLNERSRRRIKELKESGKEVEADVLKKAMQERDTRDITRSSGPLKIADDGIRIDSTRLSAEQVVDEMVKHIQRVKSE